MKSRPRRARLSIAAMMGLIAVAAVWLAFNRDRLRPRREVRVGVVANGGISVDGESLSPKALTIRIRSLRPDRVVIASELGVSYARMVPILAAVASAGVRDVQFTSRKGMKPISSDQKRAAEMLR